MRFFHLELVALVPADLETLLDERGELEGASTCGKDLKGQRVQLASDAQLDEAFHLVRRKAYEVKIAETVAHSPGLELEMRVSDAGLAIRYVAGQIVSNGLQDVALGDLLFSREI